VMDAKIMNAYSYRIAREDHTLGNLLRMCVVRRCRSPGLRGRLPPAAHSAARCTHRLQGAAARPGCQVCGLQAPAPTGERHHRAHPDRAGPAPDAGDVRRREAARGRVPPRPQQLRVGGRQGARAERGALRRRLGQPRGRARRALGDATPAPVTRPGWTGLPDGVATPRFPFAVFRLSVPGEPRDM
jgi:hypothetical protein